MGISRTNSTDLFYTNEVYKLFLCVVYKIK